MQDTQGNKGHRPETLASKSAEWGDLRLEVKCIGPGRQICERPDGTKLVHILSGHARLKRRGDGQVQEAMALPGTNWLVPAGTDEDLLELDAATECLFVLLPEKLLSDGALIDLGLDPANVRLAYAGGFSDELITKLCAVIHGLMGREANSLDRILVEGLRTALAARLIGNYRADQWQQTDELRRVSMDPRRLRRVLDLIEKRLCDPLTLQDIAGEACLSPFHFSRLFTQSIGRTPHAYIIERRVAAAKALLRTEGFSLVEIALDVGMGSQANFTRTFRKITGLTPGQFRFMHRATSAAVSA